MMTAREFPRRRTARRAAFLTIATALILLPSCADILGVDLGEYEEQPTQVGDSGSAGSDVAFEGGASGGSGGSGGSDGSDSSEESGGSAASVDSGESAAVDR